MANADRLIEIYNEANARPAGVERDRFLLEACGDDVEIKEQVLALLLSHKEAGDFLKTPVLPIVAITEKAGDTIGRYTLIEKIGEGGCGIVYVAQQTTPVRRRVAVKVVKLGMDTQSVISRFAAEQQALAMMDHPNIAKVFDAGATPTGRPYFVMELVDGIPITKYCDSKNLPTKERLKLFMQVCHAVQHAHQKGIIHRDIKPTNILVTHNGGVPVTKVIDFGIAKAIEGRLSDQTLLTAFAQLLGTPAYMSPEQTQLNSVDIDTRSDVYSLGVLLYELVTGTPPFDTAQILAGGIDGVRRIICEKEPIPPSTRLRLMADDRIRSTALHRQTDVSSLIHSIKGDLDWITIKCLEKDRVRRYDTASGLGADISNFLNHEPVLARPPTLIYRLQKLCQRHKLAFTAAVVLITVLVAGIIVSTHQANRARTSERAEARQRRIAEEERTRAVAARREAQQNAYAADMLAAQKALSDGRLQRARNLLDAHEPKAGEEDYRGFEWFYYRKLSEGDQSAVLLDQAHRPIRNSVVSLAGNRAALLNELELKVLQINPMAVLRTWPNKVPKGGVLAFEFSPEADVVGVLTRSSLILFSVTSGTEMSLPLTDQNMLALSETSHGLVATGKRIERNGPGTVQIWDYTRQQKITHLPAASGPLLRWKKDSANLITLNQDGMLSEWDGATGTLLSQIALKDFDAGSIHYWADLSNDGSRGVVTSGADELLFFSKDGTIPARVAWPGRFSAAPVISGDGRRCAFGEGFGGIAIIDALTGRKLMTLAGHRDHVSAIGFSNTSNQLVSVGRDNRMLRWDLSFQSEITRRYAAPITNYENFNLPMKVSPDGRFVAALQALWRSSDLSFIRATIGRFEAFSPDSTMYATLNSGELSIWPTESTSTEPAARFPLAISDTNAVFSSLSIDGCFFSTLTVLKNTDYLDLRVHHIKSGRIVATTNNFDSDSRFLPSREVLVADASGSILWNWEKGTVRGMPTLSVQLVNAISADGLKIAGRAQNQNEISVVDVQRGGEVMRLKGHSTPVAALAFSNDGKTLVSIDQSHELRLWSLATGREVGVMDVRGFTSIEFSPDDSRLYLASSDQIRVLESTRRTNDFLTPRAGPVTPEDSIWTR